MLDETRKAFRSTLNYLVKIKIGLFSDDLGMDCVHTEFAIQ